VPSTPSALNGVAWTFLSNHAHVLLCLARDPSLRLRDVSAVVGITERAVQKIVADLEAGGVLSRKREGRRNRYTIRPDVPLRHPIEAHCHVGDLLRMVNQERPVRS
jgi:hypothetical protein